MDRYATVLRPNSENESRTLAEVAAKSWMLPSPKPVMRPMHQKSACKYCVHGSAAITSAIAAAVVVAAFLLQLADGFLFKGFQLRDWVRGRRWEDDESVLGKYVAPAEGSSPKAVAATETEISESGELLLKGDGGHNGENVGAGENTGLVPVCR